MLEEQKPVQQEAAGQQVSQAPAPRSSNTRWIALGIGGGCVVLLCVGAVVVLAVAAFWQITTKTTAAPTAIIQQVVPLTPRLVQPDPQRTQAAPLGPGSNTLGDPNAPVKITEYADFQCPYCMHYWQQTEPQIIEQYVKTGKVFYEYRSVGAFLGAESGAAAEAAYCAGDQGKFWEYHDTLFSHWTGENVGDFSEHNLQQYAASTGLDQQAFNDCLSSGKYAARVQQDVKDARAAGVSATPSFLINGQLLEGAQPFEAFQQMIEAALQGK